MSVRRAALVVVLLAVAAACAWPAIAESPGADDGQQPITAGREAFAEGSFPWYDSATDALQPIAFRNRPDWQLWDLGSLLKVLMWIGLALLTALLVYMLYVFIRNQTSRAVPALSPTGTVVLAADQVEALPFLAQRRRDDLLGQARFHYEQGNYSEAIIYLFSYQLVELDKFSVIRLAKGKTNRQYLRETARVAALRPALEQTMFSFESVFFGRRPLSRAGFEACWNALPQFDEQLRATT